MNVSNSTNRSRVTHKEEPRDYVYRPALKEKPIRNVNMYLN